MTVVHLEPEAVVAHESTLRYAEVKEEAGELKEYIQVARLLKSMDTKVWQGIGRETIQRLLVGTLQWAGGEARDVAVRPPHSVHRGTLLASSVKLRPSQLLLWALAATFTEVERKALAA